MKIGDKKIITTPKGCIVEVECVANPHYSKGKIYKVTDVRGVVWSYSQHRFINTYVSGLTYSRMVRLLDRLDARGLIPGGMDIDQLTDAVINRVVDKKVLNSLYPKNL